MTWAVLPVKSPRESMQRLSEVLTPDEREGLARALYREMLSKLLQAECFDEVAVTSSDSSVLDHARGRDAHVFRENHQTSHSASADWAAKQCLGLGARTVALLPIDVPLATTDEIEDLVTAAKDLGRSGLVIVPSEDGTGTNALVRTPPDVIKSRFGPGSYEAHMSQAHQRNVPLKVVRSPGLVFDIDTPDDILTFLQRADDGPIAGFLRQIGAEERAKHWNLRQNAGQTGTITPNDQVPHPEGL